MLTQQEIINKLTSTPYIKLRMVVAEDMLEERLHALKNADLEKKVSLTLGELNELLKNETEFNKQLMTTYQLLIDQSVIRQTNLIMLYEKLAQRLNEGEN